MIKQAAALSTIQKVWTINISPWWIIYLLSAVWCFSNRSILGDGSQWSRDCAMLEKYLELVVSHPVSLPAHFLQLSSQHSVLFADTWQGLPSGKLSWEGRACRETGQAEEGLVVRGEGQVGRQELLGQGLWWVVWQGARLGPGLQHQYQVSSRH